MEEKTIFELIKQYVNENDSSLTQEDAEKQAKLKAIELLRV